MYSSTSNCLNTAICLVFMCHLRGHLYSLTLARIENAFSVTSRDVIGPYYRLPVSSIFDKAHWTRIYNYYSSSMTRPIYCSFFVCNRAVRKTTKLHKMTKHYNCFWCKCRGYRADCGPRLVNKCIKTGLDDLRTSRALASCHLIWEIFVQYATENLD